MASLQSALHILRSRNQSYKNEVMQRVLQQSGLSDSNVVDAIHDTPQQSTASVAQSIHNATGDLDRIKYAAAFYGLYTATPSVMIFHTDAKGPDSLYKWKMQGSGQDIHKQLNDAGIHQRLLIPSNDGFYVLVADPQKQMRSKVGQFLQSSGIADAEESQGNSEYIGGQDEKSSRENYREIIKSYENQQNGSN